MSLREENATYTDLRVEEVQKSYHTVEHLRSGTTYSIDVITVGTSGLESASSEIITEKTGKSRKKK